MYHKKKIGVFISHIFGYYQKNVCQGIIDQSLEYGYTTEIYTSMDGENLGAYDIGEEGILHIPNYSSLDGVIFASETYLSDELKEKILTQLKTQCQCPIVEISVRNHNFPAVCMDNNSATEELTEHLITKHNYQRICFLGCSEEAFFSDQRRDFYRKIMKKHNRPVGTHDIYDCEYSNSSVSEALDSFLSDGKPDAVICYNDRLALLFMQEAIQRGYNIPEDIAITGCDDSPEGHNMTPALTTVSFPLHELGTMAVEKLISLIHGENGSPVTTLTASAIINNSCGCSRIPNKNAVFLSHELNQRIMTLENSILVSMSMSAAFQHITDIDDGMDLLEDYIHEIKHCKECYLCLYSDWDSVSDHIIEIINSEKPSENSDMVILKFAFKDGKRLPECTYKKTSLLPDYIYESSDSTYIYSSLYFENKVFGYIAFSYDDNRLDFPFHIVHWLMNINQMLRGISTAKQSGLLIGHLEDIYMKDALTGLYNKHGYNHYEKQLLSRAAAEQNPLTVFLFDLNNLKKINDNFGHNEGDFAIQAVGHTLENIFATDDICARFSGDEFYVLTSGYCEKDAKDLVQKTEKYLSNYSRLSSKEYEISVSSGYACSPPGKNYSASDIKVLFSKADEQMYQNKKNYHAVIN